MEIRMQEDRPQEPHHDNSGISSPTSLSPTSTLCAEEERMDIDVDEDQAMWADINDTTPAVETWVPAAFFHRLKKILSYVDSLNARFHVGDVPVDCKWGPGPMAFRLVCNGQVVRIWVVGHLRSLWVLATEDDPRPCMRVGLDLLRNVDVAAVRRLMAMSTVQPTAKSWLSTVDFCADKVTHTDGKVFRDIYDARRTYTQKSTMAKLQPTDLTIGDIVLVECGFVRTRVDRSSTAQWSAWTTAFQLHALSVLLSKDSEPSSAYGSDVAESLAEGFDGEL